MIDKKINNYIAKNKLVIFAVVGFFIVAVSFAGYYFFYSSTQKLLPLENIYYDVKKVLYELQILSYLYIYLSVFSFLIAIFHIDQYIKTTRLRDKVYLDELSSLSNRNYLENVLSKKINPRNYIAIMCDIDHFKKVNDTYGHDMGDKVIRFVGEMINSSIRKEEDIAIRYGGEEFLILINKTVSSYSDQTIFDIFDRLHTKIKNKIFIANHKEFTITMSFGINCYTNHLNKIEESIKMADIALYHAKRERNLIVLYTENNRTEFGMDVEQFYNYLINNKLLLGLHTIVDNNNNVHAYNADLYFSESGSKYSKESFETLLNIDKKLLKLWIEKSLYCIKHYYKKEIPIFLDIKASWLLEPELFSLFNKITHEFIVLNIYMNTNEYHLVTSKIKVLKMFYKVSLVDDGRNSIFNIIEEEKVDYIYIPKNDFNYYLFILRVSKEYGFKCIISDKKMDQEKKQQLKANNLLDVFYH